MEQQSVDIATLLFTQIKVENEIRNIWNEIKRIRADQTIPEPIRNIELARLFEVHNELEVESTRKQEDYMACFLRSLQLEELGVKPITEGKLKCHLIQQIARKPKTRAISYGFFDSYADSPDKRPQNQQAPSSKSDIIIQRKTEINQELRRMSFKETLTPEEKSRRQDLVKQLRNISDS